jgi:hypothetical protein
MPITIDIQENPFLREIFEEGRQEGRQEEAAVLLGRLLERRFGLLPPWAQQQLAAADIASLETWACDCSKLRLWKKCYGLPKWGASY